MMKPMLLAALLASLAANATLAETTAITNARIISLGPAGDIIGGTVLVRDSKIVEVGKQVKIPADAKIVDAHGQFLTPALMMGPTTLALKDLVGNGGSKQSKIDNLSAGYEVADDFNPRHPHVAEARVEGVAWALAAGDSTLTGQVFAGQAALANLASQRVDTTMIVNPHAALYLSASDRGAEAAGGGAGALRVRLKQALADARAYRRSPASFDLARLEEGKLSRPDMAALEAVIEGREPLLIEANRAQEILNILALAQEERIKVVLVGATEGWMVARQIAAAKVAVIVDGEINQAYSFDDLNATYENAALLVQAGVMIAFRPTISRTSILDRSPRWMAGRAARYGLRLHDALAAISLNPAKMFGVAGRYGSIEVGKDADLVIWSGDPFETTTLARMVMIGGVQQPMAARNRDLAAKYVSAQRPAQ